ncbi:GTPase domain-containing protein [Pseudomonas sp. HR1]|uniref:GTPase domain-containing protein n=1 Tax=Pseudomonas sp. HR1 TaxID=1463361 RepID=UPI002542E2BE|nr:GTPase domain-containing protein [Pseudomonas sp. HR1]MDK4199182.1 GTPase domain-containing protein [Pseudomonas sp. HR1]
MVALLSGAAALTGTILSVPLAATLGGVALFGSVAYIGYKSVPPKAMRASQFLNQQISIEDLLSLDEKIVRVVVVGASQSGKSTFLKRAQHRSAVPSRTNTVRAEMLMLPGDPPHYVALLDADGKEYVQQFEVSKEADFLILFVDHNASSVESLKSDERLADHDRFIEQIEPVIKRGTRLARLHLLFNKRDLWEAGQQSSELEQWFQNHVAAWKRIQVANELTFSIHSNNNAQDMAGMMENIRDFVADRNKA